MKLETEKMILEREDLEPLASWFVHQALIESNLMYDEKDKETRDKLWNKAAMLNNVGGAILDYHEYLKSIGE